MDDNELEAQRLHDERMSLRGSVAGIVSGPRRFSAFGNLVIDADMQDAGLDPEIATCADAGVASLISDVLEIHDRGYRIKL